MSPGTLRVNWPAEWEPHEATWIAWPHHEPDWPGKLDAVGWVYVEIVRLLSQHERVEILCHDIDVKEDAKNALLRQGVSDANYRFHVVPNNRSWLRDSAPTAVRTESGAIAWVHWRFNGWAKYDNYELDSRVPSAVAAISGKKLIPPVGRDQTPVVLEGGSIETDGCGTMLTSEECLLSEIQERNPGYDQSDYEALFRDSLGISKTIWLDCGIAGDDTHGHIDDIARFVAPGKVVLAYESNPNDPNHESSRENLRRLESATDASGGSIEVIKLPMPSAVMYDGERLPASYCNFYIANNIVIVPTFNDPKDRIALGILAECFPKREVVGLHAVDLVLGLGTLHCLTQQQPR